VLDPQHHSCKRTRVLYQWNIANKISPGWVHSGVLSRMSRTNWLSVSKTGVIAAWFWFFAAVLIVLAASWPLTARVFAPGDFEADEIECRAKYKNEHSKAKGAAASDNPEAKAKEEADTKKDAREYCIQRRSASAGEYQGDIAKWAAGATFLAMVAAGLAAAGALGTVRTMQDTARTELRAFVTETGIHFKAHANLVPGGNKVVHTWDVRPRWENSGTTPARRVSNHVSCGIFQNAPPSTFTYPDVWPAPQEPFVTFLIGPRAAVHGEEVTIPVSWLQQTQAGTARVYIWGWIEYDDALSGTRRHRTEFCMWIDPQDDPTVASITTLTGRYWGPHNGADDDCLKQPQTT
jgi:hypothetical protein